MQQSWLVLLVLFACPSHGGADAGPPVIGVAATDAPTVSPPPQSMRAPPHDSPPPEVATDWCIEGLSALDEGMCYVLPQLAAGKPRRLLLYLHGIVPPVPTSPQKRTVENAVLRACLRAGVAALVPRGRRGIGPAHARDWWAWPTAPAAHVELTPSIVEQWVAAKRQLEAIAGAPFERTYLAGSSNGAYFLAALALRGDPDALGFPVDGFGAMSGGAAGGRGPDRLAKLAPRPFYVGFGTYDDETRTNVRSLVTILEAAHWPVRVAEHPLGHGANEVYLDEAFAFWEAANRWDGVDRPPTSP